MNNTFGKKFVSAILMISSITNIMAMDFNSHADKFFKTQTGSHLHAMFPNKKPEEAIKSAIDTIATMHQADIQGFDFTKKEEEINRLYKLITPLIQNEMKYEKSHYFFYTGFANGAALYMDVLKEFMDLSALKFNTHTNPYRIKYNTKINNVSDFLDNFTAELKKDAESKKGQKLNDKIPNFDGNPIDLKRNSGFAYAPDLITYARENLICTNVSLFGNMNRNQKSMAEGECTFLYFLKSFNIGAPNDFLIRSLFEKTGLAEKDAAAFDNQIEVYKNIFQNRLSNAGGGLDQIMVKRNEVDQMGYASWAKGVPYYMNRKTGKFAVRDNNHEKSVPLLVNQSKKYVRPKLSGMLDLYKKDFAAFSRTYSNKNTTKEAGDRFQVRLFVNPETFMDPAKVNTQRIYRNGVDSALMNQYKNEIKNQMIADFSKAIAEQRLTKEYHQEHFGLSKISYYVFGKTAANHVDNILSIVKNAPKKALTYLMMILEESVKKIPQIDPDATKKLDLVKRFIDVKEKLYAAHKYSFKLFRIAAKAII